MVKTFWVYPEERVSKLYYTYIHGESYHHIND